MNRVLAFFRGKGFYLALMACILAAALCSFWAIRTVTQQLGSKDEVLSCREGMTHGICRENRWNKRWKMCR